MIMMTPFECPHIYELSQPVPTGCLVDRGAKRAILRVRRPVGRVRRSWCVRAYLSLAESPSLGAGRAMRAELSWAISSRKVRRFGSGRVRSTDTT